MVTEWVTAAGAALVNAAATDAWQTARDGFAQLFGRGDTRRHELAATRLGTTAAKIEQAADADVDNVRRDELAVWQTRLADLLDEDPDVASELRALTHQITAALATGQTSVQAVNSGAMIQTNTVHAEGDNSLAINRMDNSTIVDRRRQYRIGTIRVGTGGLVGLIVIAVVLLGAGTAGVIYAVTPPSINLNEVKGTWSHHEQESGRYMDTALTVEVPTFHLTMDIYDRAKPSGERTGIQVVCKGEVTADVGEAIFHVHFKTHRPLGNAANITSWCPDWFAGIPADSGRTLELSSPSGQPIRFQRS